MKVGFRKLSFGLAVAAAVALLPAKTEAQSPYSPMFWSFEGGVGLASPMGDLADGAEAGPSFSGAASYFIRPQLALRAEGGADMFGTAGAVDPNLMVLHALAGVEYHLSDPMGSATLAIDAMAGVSTFDSDAISIMDYPSSGDFTVGLVNGSYPSAALGIKAGFNLAQHAESGVPLVTVFAHAKVRMIMADAEDNAVYMALNDASGFDTAMVVPLTAGIRINLP